MSFSCLVLTLSDHAAHCTLRVVMLLLSQNVSRDSAAGGLMLVLDWNSAFLHTRFCCAALDENFINV